MRKMPAFRDDLSADDQVHFAVRNGMGRIGGRLGAGERVARHHQYPGVSEELACFLGDPFDPRPDGCQALLGAAGRTGGRKWLGVTAMMALELAARPVLDEPRGAVRALHTVPAMAAEGERSVAAPVQEQHRLLAPGECLPYRLDQR